MAIFSKLIEILHQLVSIVNDGLDKLSDLIK